MSHPPPPPDPTQPLPGGWPDPQPDPRRGPQPPGPAPAGQIPPGGYPPYPGYPAAPSPPGYGYLPYPYPAAPPTNGLAIAALVCSVAGFVTCVSAPVGAILGHVARRQIRQRGEQGDGMALAGIIVGWIATGLGLAVCLLYVGFFGWFGWVASQDPNSF